ncbi:MAG: hypothetical protein A2Y12_06155 [Planctomycetes bacterium GWF2_42_9]|nr:MAG: hypothetical protein A2Y12_06155 [Planctomycetes bacterium GWF2_42_9]HAL45686.1 hypothetical protein [Phycisphaerales bacterium]
MISEGGSMGNAIANAVSQGLAVGSKLAAGNVIKNHLLGQDLKKRSGDLARAVDGWKESAFDAVVGVRENSAVDRYKYLLGDEKVTITPKRAKFLAIPMPDALTEAGVLQGDYRAGSGQSLKDIIENSFLMKSKSGGLFIAKKFGKTDRSIKPLFILKKSVVVMGTGALAAGVLESADDITNEIANKIEKNV